MVAEDAGFHTKDIHYFLLDLAAVEVEVESALHGIAGVDKQHILLCGAHAVDNGFAAHHSSQTVGERVCLRVGIVGVQYHEFVFLGCFLRAAAEEQCRGQYPGKSHYKRC